MKTILLILLSSFFLFLSSFASPSRDRKLYPTIEMGYSKTSFKYNDYISSRLKNTKSEVLFNYGGFLEIPSAKRYAIAIGIRYVRMGTISDYYFVEPIAYHGKLETMRNYLVFSGRFKFIIHKASKLFLFFGPELRFLLSERIRNEPSSDYHKMFEYDNDPLFCDDCGRPQVRRKMCICGGLGFEFKIMNQIFFLQSLYSYGLRSTSACYDYHTREFNLSIGYKF